MKNPKRRKTTRTATATEKVTTFQFPKVTLDNYLQYLSDLAATHLNRQWSAHQINSAVCGHMLVTWVLVVSLAFFLTNTGDSIMNIGAFAFGMLAIFVAWLMPPAMTPLRSVAIISTVAAWALIVGSVVIAAARV